MKTWEDIKKEYKVTVQTLPLNDEGMKLHNVEWSEEALYTKGYLTKDMVNVLVDAGYIIEQRLVGCVGAQDVLLRKNNTLYFLQDRKR